ncbi:hypothetical protein [Burkholderia sp. MSMB1589WGS]|uniref:hypothetical protein n=1 Tax=Burkholderia sp. MSMB1589WGS TaxID=1636425 RepID=UPI0009EF4B9C|nr:hypothetical protein [Burkholderia sp. MSMB1589WGS]
MPGMGCCRVAREQVQLCCERPYQLACGVAALAYRIEAAPEQAGRLFVSLISTFPDRVALFIERASLSCAALPTKTERHAFRNQIVGRLSAANLEIFDESMSTEWRRLRGK